MEDPETHERVPLRDLVKQNRVVDYFHLPSLPGSDSEYVVNFRKICPVGIQFFIEAREERLAALTEDSLAFLYSRLMWFFTRTEYFFRPITCPACNAAVPIDVRFHGQTFDVEEWE